MDLSLGAKRNGTIRLFRNDFTLRSLWGRNANYSNNYLKSFRAMSNDLFLIFSRLHSPECGIVNIGEQWKYFRAWLCSGVQCSSGDICFLRSRCFKIKSKYSISFFLSCKFRCVSIRRSSWWAHAVLLSTHIQTWRCTWCTCTTLLALRWLIYLRD